MIMEAIMRLLFEMDKKDYDLCTHRYVRDSARSIIIRDGTVAMDYSTKYARFGIESCLPQPADRAQRSANSI